MSVWWVRGRLSNELVLWRAFLFSRERLLTTGSPEDKDAD